MVQLQTTPPDFTDYSLVMEWHVSVISIWSDGKALMISTEEIPDIESLD